MNNPLRIILFSTLLVACSGGTTTITPIPPPLPPSSSPILYSTLDGPADVAAPTIGSGSGALITTLPANDFVSARVVNGLRTDAAGEHATFRQIDGGLQNIELERGTMEFWYRPAYDHNDNGKYDIAGTGRWLSPGAWHLGKHNHTNQNAIFLILYDGSGTRFEHNVPVANYSWKAGDWVHVRVTWDFNVAAGTPNLRLYLNGNELALTGEVARGPRAMPAENPLETVYIGSRGAGTASTSIIARGDYDELRVWNRVVPPT
ncbi:MAG: LamG-like jellyroll fold domain-containing protein [Gemmatimonadota bacterium]